MADAKAKKTRTVKPVYVVMQVKDENGQTIKLTKENVTVISTHKDAGELLDMLDAGRLPEGAFYKRIALA